MSDCKGCELYRPSFVEYGGGWGILSREPIWNLENNNPICTSQVHCWGRGHLLGLFPDSDFARETSGTGCVVGIRRRDSFESSWMVQVQSPPEQWQKAATQTRCDQFDQISIQNRYPFVWDVCGVLLEIGHITCRNN